MWSGCCGDIFQIYVLTRMKEFVKEYINLERIILKMRQRQGIDVKHGKKINDTKQGHKTKLQRPESMARKHGKKAWQKSMAKKQSHITRP